MVSHLIPIKTPGPNQLRTRQYANLINSGSDHHTIQIRDDSMDGRNGGKVNYISSKGISKILPLKDLSNTIDAPKLNSSRVTTKKNLNVQGFDNDDSTTRLMQLNYNNKPMTASVSSEFNDARSIAQQALKKCNVVRHKNLSVQPCRPGIGQARLLNLREENRNVFGKKIHEKEY